VSTESQLGFEDLFPELDGITYNHDDTTDNNVDPLNDDFLDMDFDFNSEFVAPATVNEDPSQTLSEDPSYWQSLDNVVFDIPSLPLDVSMHSTVLPAFDTYINYDDEAMASSLQ